MFQDSDLKQYLDHCGNLMSMHNVKVRASEAGVPTYFDIYLPKSPAWEPTLATRIPAPPATVFAQTFKCRKQGKALPFSESRSWAERPPPLSSC